MAHFINENWKPYLCHVNGKSASILVDIGLRNIAPDSSKPWLLWAWVYFNQPRPDGLSSGEEFKILCDIEDKLTPSLQERCRALPVGRITTEGRREFYYYGPSLDGFDLSVQEAMSHFKEYEFDWGTENDPRWQHYLSILYPSDDDMQRISNREVLDSMERQGDQPDIPREILHWCYFATQANRAHFRNQVQALGYRIDSETQHPSNETQYGLCFGKTQQATSAAIDDTVLELHRLTQRFEGEYDGWEAEVIINAGSKTARLPN